MDGSEHALLERVSAISARELAERIVATDLAAQRDRIARHGASVHASGRVRGHGERADR